LLLQIEARKTRTKRIFTTDQIFNLLTAKATEIKAAADVPGSHN